MSIDATDIALTVQPASDQPRQEQSRWTNVEQQWRSALERAALAGRESDSSQLEAEKPASKQAPVQQTEPTGREVELWLHQERLRVSMGSKAQTSNSGLSSAIYQKLQVSQFSQPVMRSTIGLPANQVTLDTKMDPLPKPSDSRMNNSQLAAGKPYARLNIEVVRGNCGVTIWIRDYFSEDRREILSAIEMLREELAAQGETIERIMLNGVLLRSV